LGGSALREIFIVTSRIGIEASAAASGAFDLRFSHIGL
jgi:hypothetical protein